MVGINAGRIIAGVANYIAILGFAIPPVINESVNIINLHFTAGTPTQLAVSNIAMFIWHWFMADYFITLFFGNLAFYWL